MLAFGTAHHHHSKPAYPTTNAASQGQKLKILKMALFVQSATAVHSFSLWQTYDDDNFVFHHVSMPYY